jgi:hypothetical protein
MHVAGRQVGLIIGLFRPEAACRSGAGYVSFAAPLRGRNRAMMLRKTKKHRASATTIIVGFFSLPRRRKRVADLVSARSRLP